jgi:hypothetical protein
MMTKSAGVLWLGTCVGLAWLLSPLAALADPPKSAQEFAAQYMQAIKNKDMAAVKKLRYPMVGKSPMQDFMDLITEADMSAGTQYDKFEILPVDDKVSKPTMGPDGIFYKPNLTPTNMLKLTAATKDVKSSTTFPIGQKDGIFYAVCPVPDTEAAPPFKFGWQRFALPKSNWSVMLPNEAEPGAQALAKQFGQDALNDPDSYGVVKNTADIKTCQRIVQCGAEGKRLTSEDNKETFRASCTTYTPETLKKWFPDPKKTLEDTIDVRKREISGEIVQQSNIDLAGAPGREFEIRGHDGTLYLGRVYWVKDALYQLIYESRSDKPDRDSAKKFLASLQVN